MDLRQRIVRRIARELKDGDYVNLGIGMPTLVANHVPAGIDITLHSENGMLGVALTPFVVRPSTLPPWKPSDQSDGYASSCSCRTRPAGIRHEA